MPWPNPGSARRYAPLWHQDVLRAVQKRPRQFVGLLGDEAAVVSAVIDFGTAGGMQAVKPFAKSANLALRNMYGEDLRPLAFKALEEATKALKEWRRNRPCLATSTISISERNIQRLGRQTHGVVAGLIAQFAGERRWPGHGVGGRLEMSHDLEISVEHGKRLFRKLRLPFADVER